MEVILTTYFTTVKDLQRDKFWKANDFSIIEGLYRSVIRNNLNLIVFHDHLNAGFINKYSRPNVNFAEYSPKGDPLSERFECFRKYLERNIFDKVLLMDISDTEIFRNPFPLIVRNTVLINSENTTIEKSAWIGKWFERAYGKKLFGENRLLNCGVIGARYHVMRSLLDKFEDELCKAKSKKLVDMAIWNKIIYSSSEYYILTGYPVFTVFAKNENEDSGCYIKHK